MKLSCYIKIVLWVVLPILLHASPFEKKSAMVYYGDDIPYSLVGIHDYIILQPDHVNTYTHGFNLYKDDIYAYVSIGEVEKAQVYAKEIKSDWVLGKNKLWNAKVMDISNQAYQDFLFINVIDHLQNKGFKNFFFDTLDSYHIVAKSKEQKEKMRQGLIGFIHAFHKRYPKAKLIINRGFDIIDEVHSEIEAVLFESLFHGLSSKDLSYQKVPVSSKKWLLLQIDKIKSYDIPVIAVDYVPQDNIPLINKTIQDIEALGIIPYIGDRELHSIGYSSKKPMKREILVLYDDTEFDDTPNDDVVFSIVFLNLSMPIEYLGYIPILQPISTWKPSFKDKNRYAGAIFWLTGNYYKEYDTKLEKQISTFYKTGIKMLFLGTLNVELHPNTFRLLKINTKENNNISYKNTDKISCNNKYMGFEIDPFTPAKNIFFTPQKSTAICQVGKGKNKSVIAAITPWGGYAFDGSILASINKKNLWISNPFTLIEDTLRLPILPIPDVTTENGKRLFFSHVDGDGIMNKAEWNPALFSGEVLYEKILKKYKTPISISIIEAETAKHGLYPKSSEALEKIAKKMFALKYIEGVTHTYTHPFYWKEIINDDLNPEYRLKVKDYDFSLDREIGGSLTYINKTLMPKDKKANMTFWSGDCLPTAMTLEYMYKNNILHINGGDTTIVNASPWLSHIAPLGLKRGDYYQIFTGAQNENVYTNDWLGPFWGFKRVIQTFKFTNKPKRLKPIDIYYHIYSASKSASLNALRKVYEWAMKQDVMPIYTSTYIPKVMDFYEISIAKEKDSWMIKGSKSLKTIRLSKSNIVDIDASKGVLGTKEYLENQYIHLSPDAQHIIKLRKNLKSQNYLLDSNGMVQSYKEEGKNKFFTFHSEVPFYLRYHVLKGCTLKSEPKVDIQEEADGITTLSYTLQEDVNVSILCL